MGTRRLIEGIADRAWPAGEAVLDGGWLLRRTPEVARKRSNSALWTAPDGAPDVFPVMAFYAARGVPAVVQVAPLEDLGRLDAVLAEHGWTAGGATDVLVAGAQAVIAPGRAAVAPVCDEWFAAWSAIEGRKDGPGHREAIFARLPSPSAGALVERDGRPAGVGLCVVEGAWAGIFCLATDAGLRRRGVGRDVLGALAAWAAARGAERLYLQVEAGNAAAQALFAGAGFTRSHGYHYRTAPP